MHTYLYLFLAIVGEVIATSALKASDAFTKLYPSIIVVIGYSLAFYCLSLALRTMPLGIAYAIWSGVGIILIALIGLFWFRQSLDVPALIGIGLIVAGVLLIHLCSKSISHQ